MQQDEETSSISEMRPDVTQDAGPPSLFLPWGILRQRGARQQVPGEPQSVPLPSHPTLTHAWCRHGDPGDHNLRDALHRRPLQARPADESPPHHALTWIPILRLTLERPSSLLSLSVTVTPLIISLVGRSSSEWWLEWLAGHEEDTAVG